MLRAKLIALLLLVVLALPVASDARTLREGEGRVLVATPAHFTGPTVTELMFTRNCRTPSDPFQGLDAYVLDLDPGSKLVIKATSSINTIGPFGPLNIAYWTKNCTFIEQEGQYLRGLSFEDEVPRDDPRTSADENAEWATLRFIYGSNISFRWQICELTGC